MAYLIIGGTPREQKNKVNQLAPQRKIEEKINDPDLLLISNQKSIGIDQIRNIKSFLSKKSWQAKKTKTVIIFQAEAMTNQAQNAFLKTLEEPPANSKIIITTNHKNALLPTILSRCQIIQLASFKKLNNSQSEDYWQKWRKLVESNLDQRLKTAKKINIDELDKFVYALHQKLINNQENKLIIKNWLVNLIVAKEMINDNVNHQRAVDWLMLKL